jgi:hypothetical protein
LYKLKIPDLLFIFIIVHNKFYTDCYLPIHSINPEIPARSGFLNYPGSRLSAILEYSVSDETLLLHELSASRNYLEPAPEGTSVKKTKYGILKGNEIYLSLKYLLNTGKIESGREVKARIFYGTTKEELVNSLQESLKMKDYDLFLVADTVIVIRNLTKKSIRDLALIINRSKTEIESFLKIAGIDNVLRYQIRRKFKQAKRELLEEIARADAMQNTKLVRALLNSDGKRESIRRIKNDNKLTRPVSNAASSVKNEGHSSVDFYSGRDDALDNRIEIVLPEDAEYKEWLLSKLEKILKEGNQRFGKDEF